MIHWERFVELIGQHQRFVLTSHIRPDCDALGSELGMAEILRSLGKEVHIVNAQATPPHLRFLDPDQTALSLEDERAAGVISAADVLMVLDTSAWVQLGEMADVFRETTAQRIVLDHHVSEDDLGAEVFKNSDAEATGRLVVEAADHLGVELNAAMAIPLFAALATDTGWFRFPSSGPIAYATAGRLVAAGAPPSEIYRQLSEQDSLSRLQLRAIALERIQVEVDGRLAYTHLLSEDFQSTGARASDTEDFVNMALTIQGTEAALIFMQLQDELFKVSFRSRGKLDCSQLASQFGGGGHRAAAGASMSGTFADVQSRVLDAVRAGMR